MTTGLALACGEVPWEREVIAALDAGGIGAATKRYVDVASLLRDAKAGVLARVLLISPAVRGFEAKPVLALVASGVRVVVVVDTIRPPWLAHADLDCRDFAEVHLPALVAELRDLQWSDQPAPDVPPCGLLTVFAGVSGGVGVTSLAWAHAARRNALLVDANPELPALGFLCGSEPTSSTLTEALASAGTDPQATLREFAVQGRILTLPIGGSAGLGEREVGLLADLALREPGETVVDAGVSGSPVACALVARAQRVVLVTTAAAAGLLHLPAALDRVRREDVQAVVVVNRFRNAVADSRRARAAVRGLVERACGVAPVFVEEQTAHFDRAWLRGDWRPALSGLPELFP